MMPPSDPLEPESPEDARREAFEELVWAALDGLPAIFRDQLGSVAVVVEDEPSPEELARAHATGLFGLYTGVPRTAAEARNAAIPSKITIYRLPHEGLFRTPEALRLAVDATVRHEVAHHLGISDARLAELSRRSP